MRKFTTLILFFTLLTTSALAGGYQVNLQGQKQIGMGVIGTAFALDASCIFYNPGGLSFINHKNSLSLGLSSINSYTVFRKTSPSTYQAETDNKMTTPFYFYGSRKFSDKLSAGIGIFTPYGSSLTWEEGWDGRYLIKDISFSSIYIQPTISYKINDKIGIGFGFSYIFGKVEITKSLPVSDGTNEGEASLTGNTSNFGFSLGLFLKPTEKLNVGISYRSLSEMKVEGGDAKFTTPASLGTKFPADNKFDANLPLPSNLVVGLSYKYSEKLTVGIDLQYVMWSVYDSLIFDFEINTSSLKDSHNPRLYEDRLIIRIGGQYKMNDKLTIRAGGYYDPSPVKDDYLTPETPSSDQLGLSAGLSYSISEKFSIDASFLYLKGYERDANYSPANFGGTYKSNTYIPGIGLNYNF